MTRTEQTPVVVTEENTETAAAAAARVASPVPGYKVTYPYGIKDPRYAAGYHTGDDYAAPTGSKVVAVLGGTIVWSNNNGGSLWPLDRTCALPMAAIMCIAIYLFALLAPAPP